MREYVVLLNATNGSFYMNREGSDSMSSNYLMLRKLWISYMRGVFSCTACGIHSYVMSKPLSAIRESPGWKI